MKVYHGTSAEAASSILGDRFNLKHERWGRGWGHGLYVSWSPHFAAMWGEVVLVCELHPGIKVLWHRPHDPKVIAYLKREFGVGIVEPDFWKILPENKQLRGKEIAAVWNYLMDVHYISERRFNRDRFFKLTEQYSRLYEQLRRHGYQAVGLRDPEWAEMMVLNPAHVLPLHSITAEEASQLSVEFQD